MQVISMLVRWLRGCRLTSWLEGAREQGNVVQAEADCGCGPDGLKAEAGHLVKGSPPDAAPEIVLMQSAHFEHTAVILP